MEKNKSRRMMAQCPAMPECAPQKHVPKQCMPECIPQEELIENVRLAAAYVPWQKMCSIFSPLEALKRGTIFPELYSPYVPYEKMCCNGETISRRGSYEG